MVLKIYYYILLIGLGCIPLHVQGQESFQVIETLGKVRLASSKSQEEIPPLLEDNDRLIFQDTISEVFMLRDKRWYIAEAKSIRDVGKARFVWECLRPLESWAQTRCMICEPYTFRTLREEILEARERYLILGERLKLRMDARHIKLDEHNFAAIRFEHKNEPISRTISYENDQIIISKDLLYSKTHQPIPQADTMLVAFFYVERYDTAHFKEKKITEVAETRLVFLEEDKLQVILDKVKGALPNLPGDSWDMAKLMQLYLYERYEAYILLEILKKWIESKA